jgi:hypothetical protein
MFRRTFATPARQSEIAVAQRCDCCPVRPAEAAMSYGEAQCALSLSKSATTGIR